MVKSEIVKILKKNHKKLNYSQISDLVDAIFSEISKSLIKNRASINYCHDTTSELCV